MGDASAWSSFNCNSLWAEKFIVCAANVLSVTFQKGFIHSGQKKSDLVGELFDALLKEVLFCVTQARAKK